MNFLKVGLTGIVIGILTIFVFLPLSLMGTALIVNWLPLDLMGGFASLLILILEALLLGVMVILALGFLVKFGMFGTNSFKGIPNWLFVRNMKSISMCWTP